MGIYPEEVLIKDWVSPLRRIEHTNAKKSLDDNEDESDADHGRGQNLNPCSSIKTPYEKG
jgi:hypothetical protein